MRSLVGHTRSIGTLDVENLFGAFQDWGCKGTGVLRAEEVPQAMLRACDLYDTRLNESRGFYMHTSSARVYPVPPMLQSNNDDIETWRLQSDVDIRRLRSISMRDHLFDMPERKKTNPKRKLGTITSLNEPAKGSKGILAERYKVDESKILPHVRAGILLDDNLT